MTAFAELQATSNFSFLRGASHPEELALTAAALGLTALAVTDRNSLAGVVRAHCACKEVGIRLVVGARLDLEDGPSLLVWPADRAAYGRLSRLITTGRLRAAKGECRLRVADLAGAAAGQWAAVLAEGAIDAAFADQVAAYRALFGRQLSLAASHGYRGDDGKRLARLAALGRRLDVPLLATNDVHYHTPDRRPLQDVLTCIREHCTVPTAGWRLAANAERHLKSPAEMARLFRHHPAALARSLEVAAACTFSLDELRYEYPDEVTTPGETPQQSLERLVWQGAERCYPGGLPDKVTRQLRHELALIGELSYAPYFLTVHDIVRFAQGKGILCQGRGSAANSAVCYVLGITAVDPVQSGLLFERFVSRERQEPPDIDVDFEHERREEVIQYIYEKYGRDRAGMTASVTCYRGRGAIRDVGKAMGLSLDLVAKLSSTFWGWGHQGLDAAQVREAGLDPADPLLAQTLALADQIRGFPRHLSQHVGGFVISRGPLSELVPIENAAMKDRTVIEWDKDDLDRLHLLKVDVLGLGMLSCIRRAFDLLERHHGQSLSLAAVLREDPRVYDMLCRADSIGVFQVESRAQMTMLPRLRPRTYYDLVIEVAIVRPGPIQGDMVHPYLRRRAGEEKPDYPSEALRGVLEKTLGVPLFQEQAMQIAIVGAGFTPGESDQLRRAMATFKKTGTLHRLRERFITGMTGRGYPQDFAERCFNQIEGFGNYGFPESHAASFAILVYISAWLKCHYPAVFAAALLNSQPMGFYAPAQIVRDARDHGVEVRPPDVNTAAWDCTLEALPGGGHALRLGFRQIKGMRATDADALIAARAAGGPFRTVRALWRRAGLGPPVLDLLARADAFRSLGLDRRQAGWAVKGLGAAPLPLFATLPEEAEPAVALPAMALGQQVVADYAALSLTLKRHPVALLRAGLTASGFAPCRRLAALTHGQRATVAGLVLVRQQPGTASGIIFVTLEDEGGVANLVVLPPVIEAFRRPLLASRLMGASGRVERVGEVIHLKVDRLYDLSDRLTALNADPPEPGPAITEAPPARSFERHLARADEGRRPNRREKAGTPPLLQQARNFR